MIVLNLKTYEQSIQKSLLFTDIASEAVANSGLRIIVCPPTPLLSEAASRYNHIFSQHADFELPGAFTGSIPPELLKCLKVSGSLVNHSEKKLPIEKIRKTLDRMHSVGLESIACAATTNEALEIVSSTPSMIAVEPPDLIGSGSSVTKANPNIILNSVRAIKEVNHKIKVLCGAGISTKEDVEKAISLGAEGVLLASAFVKAKDPKEFLFDLVSAF